MHVSIRNIGNSKGVVLPKPLLMQAGLEDQATVELSFENNSIVLRKPTRTVRAGWAKAAALIHQKGGDEPLMGEFGNAGDTELIW